MSRPQDSAGRPGPPSLDAALDDLVIANRILANEGVIDAFGHVSIRHPARPDRYFLARSRSPELVERGDLMEFDLDSHPVDQRARRMYSERPIHGCIYKARPDVTAVCHNHARPLIPFGVTGTALTPIWHMAAGVGAEAPVWDIRDEFGDTDMLVTTNAMGDSLAKTLGPRRVCLMRGHGAAVAAHDLKATVFVSIYLMLNAVMLREARELGRVTALSEGEIRLTSATTLSDLGQARAWEYWARRAGFTTTAND